MNDIKKLLIYIKSNPNLSLEEQVEDVQSKYYIRKYGKEE